MGDKPPVLRYAWRGTPNPEPPRSLWPRAWTNILVGGGLVVGLFLLLVAILLGVQLVRSGGTFTMGPDTEALTTPEIEEIGELKFPPGAEDVRAHYDKGKDFILRVRFTIPPDQVDALIASTHVGTPLSASSIPYQFRWEERAKPWWKPPNRPARFLAGQFDGSRATRPVIYQSILNDQTDPNRYTVWFIANDD